MNAILCKFCHIIIWWSSRRNHLKSTYTLCPTIVSKTPLVNYDYQIYVYLIFLHLTFVNSKLPNLIFGTTIISNWTFWAKQILWTLQLVIYSNHVWHLLHDQNSCGINSHGMVRSTNLILFWANGWWNFVWKFG